MNFLVRKAEPDDINFILNSWLLSSRRYCHFGKDPDYFAKAEPNRQYLLHNSEVYVVCNDEEPKQLFAWICFDSRFRLVHYVYVKQRWRKMGLAKQLVIATNMSPQFATTCPGSRHPNFSYIGAA